MTREQGKQVRVGDRVVYRTSGSTGEVRVIIPDWGVEVWVRDHNNARERWWWDSITTRIPRVIKRYPRPFRFARLQPSKCCHCPEGVMVAIPRKNKKSIHRMAIKRKMEVVNVASGYGVRCNWCNSLIGSESFPERIRRARTSLKRAEEKGTLPHPRNKKATGKKKRRTSPSRDRPKRSSSPRVQSGPKKKAPKTSSRNVVLRSKRRKEKPNGTKKAVEIPTEIRPPIPTTESSAVPKAPEKEILATTETAVVEKKE